MRRNKRKSATRVTPYNAATVTGRHDPKAFASLKHFFKMDETTHATLRIDATDYISGMTMDLLFQSIDAGKDSSDVATDYGIDPPTLVDSGYNDDSQPDWGGGTPPFTASTTFDNLGSDDWLFFATGNQLTQGNSGTNLFLGDITADGDSFIGMAGGEFVSGDYNTETVTLVRDTLGNEVVFPNCEDLSGSRRCGVATAGRFGKREPYMLSLYRNGNKITRRFIPLSSGEVRTDTVDCSNLAGDVHPAANWFWADFITYGHALFHFTDGLPDDIDEGCDWMADQWSNNPLDKVIYPNWLVK